MFSIINTLWRLKRIDFPCGDRFRAGQSCFHPPRRLNESSSGRYLPIEMLLPLLLLYFESEARAENSLICFCFYNLKFKMMNCKRIKNLRQAEQKMRCQTRKNKRQPFFPTKCLVLYRLLRRRNEIKIN